MNEHDNNTEDTPVIDTDVVIEPVVEEMNGESKAVEAAVEEVAAVAAEVKEAAAEDVAEMKETAAEVVETTSPESTPATTAPLMAMITTKLGVAKKFLMGRKYTIAAVVLVLIALLGIVFLMEQQGRLNTGIFDGVQQTLSKNKAVALVNDGKISRYDLDVSMSQIATGAAAQGADVESADIKTEIQTQALDMLVNTELLKQEAVTRGIEVSGDDVEARLETLKTDVGGADVLEQRMKEFNIDEKTLRRDIKNELTIQKLLEEVFAEKEVAVTEEEILAFYEQAGGVEAGLPALDEVRTQIETQIKTSKEQEVVTAYIEELRAKATIEVLI
jgi:SurA N-terminal domain